MIFASQALMRSKPPRPSTSFFDAAGDMDERRDACINGTATRFE